VIGEKNMKKKLYQFIHNLQLTCALVNL